MSYYASSTRQPSFGLGTMPGSSDHITTYSNSYSSRSRSGSATRKYDTLAGTSTYVGSRPSSNTRPLPPGPGPLDSSGRRFSDISRRTGTSIRTGPVRADHTFTSAKPDITPSIGSRPRKFTNSVYAGTSTSTTNDTSSKSLRSQGLANTEKITNNFSNLRLNGYDSVKASPRTIDSDDSLSNCSRESRRERHDSTYEWRAGSRLSRTSSTSVNNEDVYTPRNRDIQNRTTSLSRDIDNRKKDSSSTDVQPTKSLSRQSSNSSISGTSAKYSYGGKVGLRNIGNTCFMNSVVQCLSNTRPLLEYCLKDDYMLDKNKTTSKLKGALIVAYVNLMTSFWKDKNSTYVSPNAFKSQIQKFAPRFSGYQQQDAQEFLRYLLEGLHEDVNRVTQKPKPRQIEDEKYHSDSEKAAEYWNNYQRYDHSRIVDIFVGQLKSELKFDDCDHRSVTFDPFWDLSLPVSKMHHECDITDCLSLFMKEEKLEGDESPTCAKCKKRRSCTKRFSIQKFPPILVLHLKRFSQERYSRKITTLVNFPTTSLDLSEFAAEKGQRPVYNLYAVSEHSGTTFGGHYTAKCKHPYSGDWNSFNDTRVESCGANQAVSLEAYVLFFELASSSPSRL